MLLKSLVQEQHQGDECICIEFLCFYFTWKRISSMEFESLSRDLVVVQFANYKLTGIVTQNLKEK